MSSALKVSRRTVLACTVTFLGLSELLRVKAGARGAMAARVSAQGSTVTAVGMPVAVTHGIVQVAVTVADGKITKVSALQLPHDNTTSWRFSLHAATILRTEVLAGQCATVDAVSGATYTSDAYMKSLQAALDAASFTES